jgi:hypothetical protein
MLDLGTSFVASVERDPEGLAIVDGDVRLTHRQWYGKISALVAAFDAGDPEQEYFGGRQARRCAARGA